MPAILFVCTANQFRSPIAEAYFIRKLLSIGEDKSWTVASAGTWTSANLPAHPKAVEAGAKLGLDLSTHRTREVNGDLLRDFNLIVVMEHGHKEALESEYPFVCGKVILLANLATATKEEIPDPSRDNFAQSDKIASMICAHIDKCFSKIVSLVTNPQGNQTLLQP